MKSLIQFLAICLLFLSGLATNAQAQRTKRAQTGMKFMAVSPDARASAMGDAVTALEMKSSIAQFYNPATMARIDNNINLSGGQINWIADIRYNYGTAAFRPFNGRFGVIGASFLYVDYGTIDSYIFDRTELGYRKTGQIRPWGMIAGLGYAKEISGQFSVGANIKYVSQSLGSAVVSVDEGAYPSNNYKAGVLAYDFGILYYTGFKSLTFAMTARNFSPEVTFIEEAFELPLLFKIGLSMDMFDFSKLDQDQHNLYLALEAERPRDYDEMIKIGVEYVLAKRFSVRAGYVFPNEELGVSAGFGIKQPIRGGNTIGIDYSYTDYGIFKSVQRLSATISF